MSVIMLCVCAVVCCLPVCAVSSVCLYVRVCVCCVRCVCVCVMAVAHHADRRVDRQRGADRALHSRVAAGVDHRRAGRNRRRRVPGRARPADRRHRRLAVGESSVKLLHPPLPLVGGVIGMERGCQQNDRTLASG